VITPRGLFWPLLLITIGLVFLLVNFGYVPGVTAVQLLSLWPLLLILAGVDLAIGRRWPLAALGIDVAVIALGLALLVTQPTAFSTPFFFDHDVNGAPGQRDLTVERRSVNSLSLEINGGAGRFGVTGGSTMLVETHSPNEDLRLRRADYDKNGEHADVRIEHIGSRRVGGVTANVETRIASNVPTDLEINGGAGEFIIDLSDVTISNAEINVGAATLTLTLPRPSLTTAAPGAKPVGDIKIELNAGASSIVIEVPDGVEARITTTGALLTLRSSNARVSASGSVAETSGYASAQQRVTVRVTAGASSVTVR
jgi:hypothetical protein